MEMGNLLSMDMIVISSLIFRRKVLLSDTVGFVSDLPVQVTRKLVFFVLPNTWMVLISHVLHLAVGESISCNLGGGC